MIVTRFAPSPTGPLHLGHAFSALTAADLAASSGGRFLLRIEDIDRSRARPEWERLIEEDLTWLGLDWPRPVMRQSDRLPVYHAALDRLWTSGLLYPCTCHRRDIEAAARAPQEGGEPVVGPDGIVYPGTCRHRHDRSGPMPYALPLRLDMAAAMQRVGDLTAAKEIGAAPVAPTEPSHMIDTIGDVVLSRRDMGTSYHLSVVVDDAAQAVTHVVRGADLSDATPIHLLLQRLLGLPAPIYLHHRLIRDEAGKRLAKRDDARAISAYRADGLGPSDIRRMVGL